MPRIESISAFLSVDAEDGNEGIVGSMTPNGMWMPLVAADETRLQCLMPFVQKIANEIGRPIRLVRFTKREEVGFITPKEQ
jgi:hypothetical protein